MFHRQLADTEIPAEASVAYKCIQFELVLASDISLRQIVNPGMMRPVPVR